MRAHPGRLERFVADLEELLQELDDDTSDEETAGYPPVVEAGGSPRQSGKEVPIPLAPTESLKIPRSLAKADEEMKKRNER